MNKIELPSGLKYSVSSTISKAIIINMIGFILQIISIVIFYTKEDMQITFIVFLAGVIMSLLAKSAEANAYKTVVETVTSYKYDGTP